MVIRRLCFILCLLSTAMTAAAAPPALGSDRIISLAGAWRFIRGGPDLSDHQGPLPSLKFADTITLPGTTDTNHKGPPSDYHSTGSLTQPYQFTGTCWYERDVTIPAAWLNKHVTAVLERTKYTQVWIDGKPIGDSPICCSAQQYELGMLPPGRHKITIAVDNRRLPPFGADSHQYSGNTQGNWNGIIGKIELRMTDPAYIDDVQIYPDTAGRSIMVKVRLNNTSQTPGEGALVCSVTGEGVTKTATTTTAVHWPTGETDVESKIPLGPDAVIWDEFHPALDQLTVRLSGAETADERQVIFGLRSFTTRGQQFLINGQPTFLRGKHDACVFPLTGHPPMTVDGWLDYLKICQSYGLNHIRFHTWTPPEAAFEAADQLGFYLQPELPFWGPFNQKVKDALKPEADRILRQFGNHPSFVMFSMGNEHWTGQEVLQSLVAELRAEDSRHLYVRGTSAFSYESRPGKGDDYLITSDVKHEPNGPPFQVRGSNGGLSAQGHVQTGPANTLTDYAKAIAGTTWPTVTHEMGQYTVFPDFRQIAKYTGVSRAYNLEQFRQNVIKAGFADQADDFARASGYLAALCYREEIESCLRTPHYGGFELLDLQDYPGQGSALVGMLDALMESKGILTPEQWRQFCSPQVLLARFKKYAWTSDETFLATIDIAQYGPTDLDNAVVKWSLNDTSGKVIQSGELHAIDAKRGDLRMLGTVSIPLSDIAAPARVTLSLAVAGTPIQTSYPLWVYPPKVNTTPPANVKIARVFDASTQQALTAGQSVLLVCDGHRPLARTVGGAFATDFWNFSFFHNKPATLGLLCDPATPALSGFPTESHSDWQWFYIALRGQPLVLDNIVPHTYRPLVQVIDNYERCHRLGLIFEVKVGPGRLLICTPDLLDLSAGHPEARQLLASLLRYAGSAEFDPHTALSVQRLQELLRTTIPLAGSEVTASSFDKGWQNFSPAQVIDGNDDKGWKADADATGACWCEIAFPKPIDLNGGEITWADARPGYQYVLEASKDGTHWETICDERHNDFHEARHVLKFMAKSAKFVRVSIAATPDKQPAAINEIRFYAPQ